MQESIQQQLLQLNRDFYSEFADAFASTRYGVQAGWERIIHQFPRRCQVLDLGCGNGRFAIFLDNYLEKTVYIGLDGSTELVEIARKKTANLEHIRSEFLLTDLGNEAWQAPCQYRCFDVVVALAVMHHIPSRRLRAQFLIAAASCVDKNGLLIVSNWRFMHNERMRRKIVPWEAIGLTEADLEPGDYLLDWRRAGTGYRYAHQIDEEEIEALAAEAGMRVVEQFYADGREGDLSLYSILRVR